MIVNTIFLILVIIGWLISFSVSTNQLVTMLGATILLIALAIYATSKH